MSKKKNKISTDNLANDDTYNQAIENPASDNEPDNKTNPESDNGSDDKIIPGSDNGSDDKIIHGSDNGPDNKINSDTSEKENTQDDEIFDVNAADKKKKRKRFIIRGLRILFTIGFLVFLALFINEVLIQPYKLKKTTEKARDLYNFVTAVPTNTADDNSSDDGPDNEQNDDSNPDTSAEPTPTPDPNRDEKGRLIKFSNLLEVNEDVKGWIRIDNTDGENDTKIDYVVMQSGRSDPEYYLTRDWATGEYLKAGSLFLDYTSSVETGTSNLIIHGHNMTSSDDMFHYLVDYQKLDFIKKHPIISFDTIYEEGLWKVFSVYITPGNNDRDDFFPFNTSSFKSNRDFMEYIYQIRIRSLFNIDEVDINEDDQILTLSTCSYELSNYRTIVVARKVREGEEPTVDIEKITKNKNALYPPSFYKHYNKKAPEIPGFEAALEDGLIPWYNPMNR